MIYKIKYRSNSVASKITFFNTFLKLLSEYNLINTSFLIQKKQQKLIKKFTIIRSPHVHKHSREQFEFCQNKGEFFIHTFQSQKFLLILKKLKTLLFSNISIKIFILLNTYFEKKIKLRTFNPNKYLLKNKKFFFDYFQIWFVYGNLYLNQKLAK